jgi:hypothetical protein
MKEIDWKIDWNDWNDNEGIECSQLKVNATININNVNQRWNCLSWVLFRWWLLIHIGGGTFSLADLRSFGFFDNERNFNDAAKDVPAPFKEILVDLSSDEDEWDSNSSESCWRSNSFFVYLRWSIILFKLRSAGSGRPMSLDKNVKFFNKHHLEVFRFNL